MRPPARATTRHSRTLAVAAITLVSTVTALAGHLDPGAPSRTLNVQPVQLDGNLTCALALPAGSFLYEYKLEPVSDVVNVPLSFGALSGSLSVDQTDGKTFNFSITGSLVVGGAFVKAGDNGNLYDYRPLGGAQADTWLHGPVNGKNRSFYGLSHISFCVAEGRAQLRIAKTPDGGAITAGEDAVFAIVVTNLGPGTANAVTIDDSLPAGLAWSTTTAGCAVAGSTTLHCDAGTLAKDASFSVTVRARTTAANCGELNNPDAAASASNADRVTDAGSILVHCGAVQVVKTAKHKDTSGATSPNLDAGFTITSPALAAPIVVRTGAAGSVCVGSLPFATYRVSETSPPRGYSAAAAMSVTVDTVASCADAVYAGETVAFDNTPLTDVDLTIDSLVTGATETVITCRDASGAVIATRTVSDGTLSIDNLTPQTLTCEIVIDP